jgi:hypothetical protein
MAEGGAVDHERDRDDGGRPRNSRPRDALGRPLPRGTRGVEAVPERALPPGESLVLAQSLLDEGRAFAAHEVLEARWKAAPPAERELWRGLAQLAVGLTHAQRGNLRGARELLRRGGDRIAAFAVDPPYGIDVPGLIAWARSTVTQLDRPTPPSVPQLAAKEHEGHRDRPPGP